MPAAVDCVWPREENWRMRMREGLTKETKEKEKKEPAVKAGKGFLSTAVPHPIQDRSDIDVRNSWDEQWRVLRTNVRKDAAKAKTGKRRSRCRQRTSISRQADITGEIDGTHQCPRSEPLSSLGIPNPMGSGSPVIVARRGHGAPGARSQI
jgi:hypothetical protein